MTFELPIWFDPSDIFPSSFELLPIPNLAITVEEPLTISKSPPADTPPLIVSLLAPTVKRDSPVIAFVSAIVISPSMSTSSKFAVPSTSKSPLKSTLPDALKVLASISPLALILPSTVNFSGGAVVPIPTLPVVFFIVN